MAHVLVVEDDLIVSSMLEMLFTEDGHLVTRARTNAEALIVLRSSPHPVVALLRQELASPWRGKDAYLLPLLEAIRDQRAAWEPHTYLVVTGYNRDPDAPFHRLIAELAICCLRMPLDIDDFTVAIAQAAAKLPTTPNPHALRWRLRRESYPQDGELSTRRVER